MLSNRSAGGGLWVWLAGVKWSMWRIVADGEWRGAKRPEGRRDRTSAGALKGTSAASERKPVGRMKVGRGEGFALKQKTRARRTAEPPGLTSIVRAGLLHVRRLPFRCFRASSPARCAVG
uniref:Secreted protein n=1 Tax=Plectus sambesii TaxID=2011161 RepID=A0A914WHR2_9BILA